MQQLNVVLVTLLACACAPCLLRNGNDCHQCNVSIQYGVDVTMGLHSVRVVANELQVHGQAYLSVLNRNVHSAPGTAAGRSTRRS